VAQVVPLAKSGCNIGRLELPLLSAALQLFTQNQAARNAVEKARKIAQLTAVADTV
jgi:hypothetical protein